MADDVLVENILDILWLWDIAKLKFDVLAQFFFYDLVAQLDTLVADIHPGAGDEFLDLFLQLAAERALELSPVITKLKHLFTSLLGNFLAALGHDGVDDAVFLGLLA